MERAELDDRAEPLVDVKKDSGSASGDGPLVPLEGFYWCDPRRASPARVRAELASAITKALHQAGIEASVLETRTVPRTPEKKKTDELEQADFV